MTTPNARIEPVVPDRPRKRKRQAVDNIRKLTDEKIKRNHLTVMDTLRDQVRPKEYRKCQSSSYPESVYEESVRQGSELFIYLDQKRQSFGEKSKTKMAE